MKIVSIFISIIADIAILAFLWRRQKGKFQIVKRTQTSLIFLTDLGKFGLDRSKSVLHCKTKNKFNHFSFKDIQGIEFTFKQDSATINEFISGFEPWDWLPKYQDTNDWYHINLVLMDRKKIALYKVGQYKPKEPFMLLTFGIQVAVLQKIGLFKDVEDVARETLNQLIREFKKYGKPLNLV